MEIQLKITIMSFVHLPLHLMMLNLRQVNKNIALKHEFYVEMREGVELIKINNASNYIGKWINVLIGSEFIKAKLIKSCLGNKDYFTGVSISEIPPKDLEICEAYIVEFENGAVDYFNELYTDKTNL